MKTMKRLLALLLALAMVMPNCLTIASAYTDEFAEESVEEVFEEEFFEEVFEEELYEAELTEEVFYPEEEIPEEELVPEEFSLEFTGIPDAVDDSEEQFAAYANSVLYPDRPAVLGTSGRDALEGLALELYDALVDSLQQIANGQRTSTVIELEHMSGFPSREELDILLDALLADMPLYLYWYDKVTTIRVTGSGYEGDMDVTFPFPVASAYSASGEAGTFETSGAKTGAAVRAAEYAAEIALSQAQASDYETLNAYGQWIRQQVTYDETAAGSGDGYFSAVDSNPWQLIYVFDENPNTNVVCEGYAKAFQYLCDLAYANEKLNAICYSVTGDLFQNGFEMGPHKWNLVQLDGERYLVDVTNWKENCNVFLVGGVGGERDRTIYYTDGSSVTFETMYYSVRGTELGFCYDQETMDLYGKADLALSNADYDPAGSESGEGSGDVGGGDDIVGDEPGEPDWTMYYDEWALQADLENYRGAEVELRNELNIDGELVIPEGTTLRVTGEGWLKVSPSAVVRVEGNLVIDGDAAILDNQGDILLCGDWSTLETVNYGLLKNYRNIDLQGQWATMTVENGSYDDSTGMETEEGYKDPEVNVRFFDEESLNRVSGLEQSQQKLYYNGDDASMLQTLAQYCGYGNPNLVKGEYAGYRVNVAGVMTIEGMVDIWPTGSLSFVHNGENDGELVLNAGSMLNNMGSIRVPAYSVLTINQRGNLDGYGTFYAEANSVINNYGTISKSYRSGLADYMTIEGEYDHQGDLFVNADESGVWYDINGVDPSLVTLNVTIPADFSDEEALELLKCAKDSGYGMTRIWLYGERTFSEHLALVTPVELHICDTLNQNAPITLDNGNASLIVEEGGELNVNGSESSLMILSGNSVTVNGTLNSNVPLHVGLDESEASLTVNGTLNNNAYLNIGSGAEVTVTGTLNHNAYDEATGLGGVIIENHGTIYIEESAVSNVRFDVVNSGKVVNNGTVYLFHPATISGDGTWEGDEPIRDQEPSAEELLQEKLNAGGMVYLEEDLTITGTVTIPNGAVLYINSQKTLTVDEGAELINNGQVTVSTDGALVVNGAFANNRTFSIGYRDTGAQVTVNGSFTNNGMAKFYNGSLTVNGSYTSSITTEIGVDTEVSGVTADDLGHCELIAFASDEQQLREMLEVLQIPEAEGFNVYSVRTTSAFTLEEDLTIPQGINLVIGQQTVYGVTIPADVTVTIEGSLKTQHAPLTIEAGGKLIIAETGSVTNSKGIVNNGTILNYGTDNWSGAAPEGNAPEVPGMTEYTAVSLQQALNNASAGETIVLYNDLTIDGMLFEIPEEVTLEIASGVTLGISNAPMNIKGILSVKGTLDDNFGVYLCSETAQLYVADGGVVNNNQTIEVQNEGASVIFESGAVYNRGEFEFDGETRYADFGLLYFSDESLDRVSGVEKSNITVFYVGEDASVIRTMEALCEGEDPYQKYVVNLQGYAEISEYTEITEKGHVRVLSGAELTICEGAELEVLGNAYLVVEDGGKIVNYGALDSNMGDINVVNGDTGYEHHEGAEVVWHHDYGAHGNITGISTEYWWVNAIAGNAEQIHAINAIADTGNYAAVTIEVFEPMTLTGPILENPYEIRVSRNAPWYVYNDITLDPGIQLTVENGATLNLWGTKLQADGIVQNHGTLDLGGGSILVGSPGILSNSGELITDGATISIQGRMYNSRPMYLTEGAVLTVDNQLENTSEIHVEEGAQLNVNSTFYNYGYLNNSGMINVDGVLNNDVWFIDDSRRGFIENWGLINVNGALNLYADGMVQEGTLLIRGMANVDAMLDNNGRTVLETTDFGGGRMDVHAGGSLDLVSYGQFHIKPGAMLKNGYVFEDGGWLEGSNGDVRIRLGTLYVMDGGDIRGPWDGHVTREGHTDPQDPESTASHLSAWWLRNDGEGWYMDLEDTGIRDMRMIPGDERWVVFYENLWLEDGDNYLWQRNPVRVTSENSEYLILDEIYDLDYEHVAEGVDGYGYVRMRAGDVWNQMVNVNSYSYSFPVLVGRDLEHGYYSAPEATNENWVEAIEVNHLADPIQDKVVYYMVTNPDLTMTGNFEIFTDDENNYGIYGEHIEGTNTIKITIPAETIQNLGDGIWIETQAEVQDRDGNIGHRQYGTDICPMDLGRLESNAWMRLDDRDLNYNAELDKWFTHGEDGPEFVDLAGMGLTYDYETNTLTMQGAKIGGLEFGYYGWDENGRNDSWYDLPKQELTLNLIGWNYITSYTDSALKAFRGVKLEITGDGCLELAAHHGEDGFHNEDYTEFWDGSAIAIGNEESSLTISGNAKVIAKVSGKAYYMEDGVKYGCSIRTIGGHYGSSTLTVKDNAQLTTIVPDGAVHNNFADPADGYTGGYRGIADFVEINVQDNAVITTQDLDIGTGYYNQTGGEVTINPLGYVSFHKDWEGVVHTYFCGIRAEGDGDGGYINISGGKLNINIPKPTTESAAYSGISMDGSISMDGGILNITGNAEVTIDGNSWGTCIELLHAAMNLEEDAVLNFPEELIASVTEDGEPTFTYVNAIVSDPDSRVNMQGGTINATGVCFGFQGTSPTEEEPEIETNGKTEWNGTELIGEMVEFDAGGNAFTVNGGRIELTGKYCSDTHFIPGGFNAWGMVQINGGEIVLNDGVMRVGAGTSLNGGSVTINNAYDQLVGLNVQNYFAINGGELNVSVPGGTYINRDGMPEAVPAAWIEGTFHQMGGTVNFTSETTMAVKSFGSVLLNDGIMNLSGVNGINQMRSENNPNGMFYVSGGELNIEAADTGIFANNSPVHIVPFDEGDLEIPAITINADGAAIQICSDEEDSLYINEYTFVNAEGQRLVLETADRRGEEGVGCFVHTLKDGENYATYAELSQTRTISQADFVSAMEAAIEAGHGAFELTCNVEITSDLELPITVRVRNNAEMRITNGATLTVRGEHQLEAMGSGKVTVEEGSRIVNDGSRLINSGGNFSFYHSENAPAYVEENNGDFEVRPIMTPMGLGYGYTVGWENKDMTLVMTCENLDKIYEAIGFFNENGFGAAFLDAYASMELAYNLTIPENVTLSFNSPVKLSGGVINDSVVSTLTVSENVMLTIEPATSEGAVPGSLFINNGAVLDVLPGAKVNNYGNLHIGDWQNGAFDVSGTMNVAAGAEANLYGYTAVHNFLAESEEASVNIPGLMNVSGTVNTYGENTRGGTGGYLQVGGALTVQDGGVINSNFLFSADGVETVILPGGTLNNNHEMFVTGILFAGGELNNTGKIYVADEENRDAKLNVTGKLTNSNLMDILDSVVVTGELVNNAGIFLEDDAASFVTEGGTVTNNAMISTEWVKATVDFTNGNYIHGSLAVEGALFAAELIGDYFADGTAANVKLNDMSKATLRYIGDDFAAAKAMIEKAKAEGYGNYIVAVEGEMEVPSEQELSIDNGGYLTVKAGSVLNVSGKLINKGTVYLDATDEAAASLCNTGRIVNEGTFLAPYGSWLENFGTMENSVGASMKLEGDYMHYGTLLEVMDTQGNVGTLTGNVMDYQKTLWAAIPESAEDPENFLRQLISRGSAYGNTEIYLYTDVTVTEELQIPYSVRLYIGAEDATQSGSLTLAEGVQLINEGLLRINSGELTINGRYIAAGTLDVYSGNVTVNGSLVNGGYMDFQSDATLINNGTIDNGNLYLNFRSGATYVHGENAELMTAYIDFGDDVSENKIEGIAAGYQTLLHPVRADFADHNEDTIRDMMAAVQTGGYAGGTVRIFDKHISITEDMTIPENVEIRVGMSTKPVQLSVHSGAELTIHGTMRIEEGEHTFFNYGTTVINGLLENCGGITNGGQLDVWGVMNTEGTVFNATTTHVYTGGVLRGNGNWIGYAPINRGGTITGDAFVMDQDALEAALAEAKANGLEFVLSKRFTLERDLIIDSRFTIDVSGGLIIPEGKTLTVTENADVTNHGSIIVSGTVDAAGSLNNDGQINVYGSVQTDGDVFNGTSVNVYTGATLIADGQWAGYDPIDMGGTITGSAFGLTQEKLEEALTQAKADGIAFVLTQNFTLERDLRIECRFIIGDGVELTVPEGVTLFIAEEGMLINRGKLTHNGVMGVCGQVNNFGQIDLYSAVDSDPMSRYMNNGTVCVYTGATLVAEGTWEGNAPISMGGTIRGSAFKLTQEKLEEALKNAEERGIEYVLTENFTLERDLTVTGLFRIDDGFTLTVPEGMTLTVAKGQALEVNGKLVNDGNVEIEGMVKINGTGINNGTVNVWSNEIVYDEETDSLVVNSGSITGNGTWNGNEPINQGGGIISGSAFAITEAEFLAGVAAAEANGTEYVLSVPVTLTHELTINGKFTISTSGQLTVAENAVLNMAENAEVRNHGVLRVNGTVNVETKSGFTNDGQIDIYGEMTISGALGNQQGHFHIVNGTTVHVYKGGHLHADGTWSGYAPIVDEGGKVTGSAAFYSQLKLEEDMRLADMEKIPLALNVPFTMEWNMNIQGTLILNDTFNIPAGMTLTIPEGATLKVNGELICNGDLVVNGELIVNGRLVNAGSVAVSGTMSSDGTVTNNGSLDVTGGLTANGDWIGGKPSGTGSISGTAFQLTQEKLEEALKAIEGTETYYALKQSFTLEKDLTVNSTFFMEQNGVLIIPEGVTLTISETGTVLVNRLGKLINYGTIVVKGNLGVNGQLTNYGEVDVTGSLNVYDLPYANTKGEYNNYGTTTILSGGVLDMEGIWTGNAPVNEGGTINGMLLTQEDLEKAMEEAWNNGETYVLTKSFTLDDDLHLDGNVEIAEGVRLTVPEGMTIWVNEDLVNNGTIDVKGALRVVGTMTNSETGLLLFNGGAGYISGTVQNDGVTNVYNNSILSGRGYWNGNEPVIFGNGIVTGKAFEMRHDEFLALIENGETLSEIFTMEKSIKLTADLNIGEGGHLVVPSGMTLTIPAGMTVTVWEGGKLTVESGGRINNYGILSSNTGEIDVKASNGYAAKDDMAEVQNWFYDGSLGKISNIDPSHRTVRAMCSSMEYLQNLKGLLGDSIEEYRRVMVTLTDSSELQYNMLINRNMLVNVGDGVELTVPAGVMLNVAGVMSLRAAELTVDGTLNINGIGNVESASNTVITVNGTLTNNANFYVGYYDGTNKLIVNGTVNNTAYFNIGANGVVENAGTLNNSGTVELSGTVNDNGTLKNTGTYRGSCGTNGSRTLNWTLKDNALTISGTSNKMTTTPWNMLKSLLPQIQNINMTSRKLGNLCAGAFADFSGVKTILVPDSVSYIGEDGDAPVFHADVLLKGSHGTEAEYYAQDNGLNYEPQHTLDPRTGICDYWYVNDEGTEVHCGYSLAEVIMDANKTTEDKVEAVKSVDTDALKEQVKAELEGTAAEDAAINASELIHTLEQEILNTQTVDVDAEVQAEDQAIADNFAGIDASNVTGAALNAGEGEKKVELIIGDPKEEPKLKAEYATDTSMTFNMTLEGVEDPKNLAAPVIIRLPIPADAMYTADGKVIILHYADGADEKADTIYATVEVTQDGAKMAVVVVTGFSTFTFPAASKVTVGDQGFGTMQAALDAAKNGNDIVITGEPDDVAAVLFNKEVRILNASGYTVNAAAGYTAQDNGDGSITVSKDVVAAIGDKTYTSLAEAIAEAEEGSTIEVKNAVNEQVAVGKTLNIVHHGNEVSFDLEVGFMVEDIDGQYQIKPIAAELNGTPYATLAGALAKAAELETEENVPAIYLKSEPEATEIGQRVTIVVNGNVDLKPAAGWTVTDTIHEGKTALTFSKAAVTNAAKIGDTEFATLEEALAAAKDLGKDAQIVLLANVKLETPIEQEVTIVKNGFTVEEIRAGDGYELDDAGDAYVVTEKVVESFFRTNIVMGEDLTLMFYMDPAKLTASNGYAKIIHDNNDPENGGPVITIAKFGDKAYWNYEIDKTTGKIELIVNLRGLAAKQMADDVTIQLFDSKNNPISPSYTTSLRDYAMTHINRDDDRLFTIAMVDMLNYGAAAQERFKYNTGDLANNRLTEAQKTLASDIGTYEDKKEVDRTYYNGTALRFNDKINLILFLETTIGNSYAVFTWEDHGRNKHEERVTYTLDTSEGRPLIVAELTGLVVADARQMVTCTIYNAATNAVITRVVQSVESRVAVEAENGEDYKINTGFMKFADSAHAFLHRNDS